MGNDDDQVLHGSGFQLQKPVAQWLKTTAL